MKRIITFSLALILIASMAQLSACGRRGDLSPPIMTQS